MIYEVGNPRRVGGLARGKPISSGVIPCSGVVLRVS
jgi:hypothetical protein